MSVAVKKGAIMAARMGPPFSWSLSLLTGGLFPERPGAVKGASLLDAAKRTLDGEYRSATIQKEGKAPDSGREVDPKKWPLRSPPLTDRIHDSLNKDTPGRRPMELRPSPFATVTSSPRLGGIHHRYGWSEAA